MTANVLDISHLTLSIEHKTILQDIDLTIGAGETAALIGESGSGKSTLAQCILGLQPQRSRLTPESRIDFLGEPLPIENDARMRRWRGCSISMIFQDPMSCLNPYLRVGTQILEALKRGSASDEDHLDAGAVQPGDLVHEGRNARGVGASVVAGQHVAASLDDDAAVFAGSVHVFAVRASPGVTVRICSPRP